MLDKRGEFGYWEMDMIVGSKDSSTVLLSLDERQAHQRHIIKIAFRTAGGCGGGRNPASEREIRGAVSSDFSFHHQ